MKFSATCILALAAVVGACSSQSLSGTDDVDVGTLESADTQATPIESAIPAARLATIKAAMPKVAWPRLQAIFIDPSTYWYDHESMQPSYQETGTPGGGAKDNAHWRDLIADTGVNDINTNPATGAEKVYDNVTKRWRFPVATTAGMDDSTNVQIVEFLSLPKDAGGKVLSIPISTTRDQIHLSWQWQYPNGTIVGEVIFIKDGGNLLPSEVRIRHRYSGGWATNAFRPFPAAQNLSAAIKAKRPAWSSNGSLNALVQQIDGSSGLAPKRLTATGLTDTFDQAGVLDVLPDFGDASLVRDLLTTTTFVSAYGAVWRQDGTSKAYAPSSTSPLSIVPNNSTAGLMEVTETSCNRCHKETGQMLARWYPGMTLYGEVWGKDNIFSFHPFDESYYPKLDLDEGSGVRDNRHMNPKLVSLGFLEQFNAAKHTGPSYERSQP